jgi:hypothetical protein
VIDFLFPLLVQIRVFPFFLLINHRKVLYHNEELFVLCVVPTGHTEAWLPPHEVTVIQDGLLLLPLCVRVFSQFPQAPYLVESLASVDFPLLDTI